jgi:alkylated DNA nucleotide flippase Atl1
MRSRRREEQGLEDRIIAAASLVARGEWTTYGDISAAAAGSKRAARAVAGAASKNESFPNAHRVLRHDGTVARTAGPGHDERVNRARRALEAEGVSFDPSGRADPAARVYWDELARRRGAT